MLPRNFDPELFKELNLDTLRGESDPEFPAKLNPEFPGDLTTELFRNLEFDS